jgi:hypothetical protein
LACKFRVSMVDKIFSERPVRSHTFSITIPHLSAQKHFGEVPFRRTSHPRKKYLNNLKESRHGIPADTLLQEYRQ